MSRDWTPRESYLVEQHDLNTGTGIGSIWDFMESVKWVVDGKSIPLHSAEELALRKQYPVFGKFLEPFNDLYYKLSQFEGGLDLLKQKDTELAAYIESGKADKDSYLIKWFEGELDSHFYYRERNDELLVSEICKEALQEIANRAGLDENPFSNSQSTFISAEEMKAFADCAAARMRMQAKADFKSLDEQIEVCSAKVEERDSGVSEINKER